MSIADTIDRVTKWVQEEICDPVKLKMPPDGDIDACPNAEDYEYREVTPAAFPLYVPTQEKLPQHIETSVPSVVVRIQKGADNLFENEGKLNLELVFSTWNPGVYGKDILIPVPGMPRHYRTLTDKEAEGKFYIYENAWRDVWNWVDEARRTLRNTAGIDGMPIDRTVPLQYGPIMEQEGIPDFYPLWYAYITFGLILPFAPYDESIECFL